MSYRIISKSPFGAIGLLFIAASANGAIVGISIPEGSMDAFCRPRNESVWSVTTPPYPFPIDSGIGFLVNPSVPGTSDFVLHDHVYISSFIPDPNRAVVTYTFDVPTAVDQIRVMQHGNGIREIEGFVGDSPDLLTSIGTADVGPGPYPELSTSVFDFDNSTSGLYFQFVVRETSLSNGWASYRAYPFDANGAGILPIPEPASLGLFAVGALTVLRRRRQAARGNPCR